MEEVERRMYGRMVRGDLDMWWFWSCDQQRKDVHLFHSEFPNQAEDYLMGMALKDLDEIQFKKLKKLANNSKLVA